MNKKKVAVASNFAECFECLSSSEIVCLDINLIRNEMCMAYFAFAIEIFTERLFCLFVL